MSARSRYSQELEDPRWQMRRNDTIKRDGYKCTRCASPDNLEVHHWYYMPDHRPWEYDSEALTTLCRQCHEHVEFWTKYILATIGRGGQDVFDEFATLAESYTFGGPAKKFPDELRGWD